MNKLAVGTISGFLLSLIVTGVDLLFGPLSVLETSLLQVGVAGMALTALGAAISFQSDEYQTGFFLAFVGSVGILGGMAFDADAMGAFVGTIGLVGTLIAISEDNPVLIGGFGISLAVVIMSVLNGPYRVGGIRVLVPALAALGFFHVWHQSKNAEVNPLVTVPFVIAAYAAFLWGVLSANAVLGRNIGLGILLVSAVAAGGYAGLKEVRQTADPDSH